MQNSITGSVLEMPPPDSLGATVIVLDGEVIERVLFSDVTGTATIGDGRMFKAGHEFATFMVSLLNSKGESA